MERSMLGDRYRLEARIGAGGMAEVYRGVDTVLNRTVAIKILNAQFARDASFVARFRREAQAAARLNHPNIVGVYDTGADGDTQYIVMEFVEGRTLADVFSSGKRPSSMQSVELAQRIAQALSVAHAQGIVHRDIKPANVMVTREGKVKVMDFGIARVQTLETAPQTSSVLGTPTYLSPEQAQGQGVDGRSDIYSLGVVLYEMLAGRPPFTGDSPVAIAYKQVNETPSPPSTLNPDVTPRLDAVVMKTLAKNPANRYQDADALAADLERVKQGQEVEATPLMVAGGGDATQVIARPQATQVMPPAEPDEGGGRMWLGILIGVLIVAILLGGGYLLAQTLTDDDGPNNVSVEDVRGSSYGDAKARLEAQGLVVTDPPLTEASEEVAEGCKRNDLLPCEVLAQDIRGAEVATGTSITLTVAVPIPQVEVPELTGQPLAIAVSLLTEEGLIRGEVTEQTSDEFDPGVVISQDPPAGEKVEPGTLVDLVVASGPTSITLGDYTCMNLNKATKQVEGLGLIAVVGGTAPRLPQCPNNQSFVTLQDPGPGAEVLTGSTVTLYTGDEEPTASPSE
ncbi:MAG TPA: Stk1 family PASTA domain-containing Ser/Thr kinase [Actinomycetota bacterium]|nr:Stk1 family PASTA domain-containing Ser/Thr kinase [Actinomycetota bacterium]